MGNQLKEEIQIQTKALRSVDEVIEMRAKIQNEILEERAEMIAECSKAIGRVQSANMFQKFATVSTLVWLKEVKDTKVYRDVPGIGTWEKFCDSVGMSRQKVDEDILNLETFGEDFMTTCRGLHVGYRELRQLRQLTNDGTVVIDADCLKIGEESIPINIDRADDLQNAIDWIITEKTALGYSDESDRLN
jgi:hypothetical protein